jgi:hypothetical protein
LAKCSGGEQILSEAGFDLKAIEALQMSGATNR